MTKRPAISGLTASSDDIYVSLLSGLGHLGPITPDLDQQHCVECDRWQSLIDVYRASNADSPDPLTTYGEMYMQARKELRRLLRDTSPGDMTESRARALGELSRAMLLLRARAEAQAMQHSENDERSLERLSGHLDRFQDGGGLGV